MKKLFILIMCCMTMTAYAQKSRNISSFHEKDVECLGVELDGSQTLRVQGSGRKKEDAMEQAKKNAVWAVIFTGIRGGRSGCDMRPLVNEANARDKYEAYFNKFFTDGGDFLKFVSMDQQKIRSKEKSKNKFVKNYTITVRVLRPQLKEQLISDNIIK